MSDSKLDLIAKLLAKAESTTPEEAEALTEHAERLMVKYGIEQAKIDDRRARLGEPNEEVVQEEIHFTGSYARDLRDLGVHIGAGLSTLRLLQSEHPHGGVRLHLIGFRSDVEQAKILTASLQVQAMVAMRAWWAGQRSAYVRDTERTKRRARSGFLRGFGVGAGRRIAESRQQILEEAGSGTDLVLISRKQRVDAVAAAFSAGTARRRQGADAHAFYDGHHSGTQATTGERAVSQGRSLSH